MGDLSPELLALQDTLVGRYSLERELGRGGMGIVTLARDVALDRLVAIKLLPPTLSADADFRSRFLEEARTVAGLSHPNIVPIHAVEEQDAHVFFVMGYVDGETLRQRVDRTGPMSPRSAMKIMQEVAWALGYAHQRGVIHRDIKPDNIMLERATGRALVTDFGIAQVDRLDSDVSAGEIVGTVRYMSPEQACAETVDGRSDLYSLGATIFFVLTGRPPFEGRNVPAILAQQVSHQPPSLRTLRPEVPERLAAVVRTCLEKAPDNRVQSGDELATAVGDVRGRDLRAPPLLRSFVRNAEISTMVVFAIALAGELSAGASGVTVNFGGPGIVGTILIVQLVLVARRLLREGYSFNDIRAALLVEARVQEEEAEAILKGRWLRKLDGMWHRLWAGRFGRWFFKVAGTGVRPRDHAAQPSTDATEFVLGRSTIDAFRALPDVDRTGMPDVPRVIESLEHRAKRLRLGGNTGGELTATVAALEKLRVAMLRLQTGDGSINDLTLHLERARAIGRAIDHHVEASDDVAAIGDTPV